MITVHLRLESVTPRHIKQAVLIDEENCGVLTLTHGAYQLLGALLMLGADHSQGFTKVQVDAIAHDANGNFTMPGRA